MTPSGQKDHELQAGIDVLTDGMLMLMIIGRLMGRIMGRIINIPMGMLIDVDWSLLPLRLAPELFDPELEVIPRLKIGSP